MKIGRKTTLALLLAIICFNLLLRYPQSEHEVGVDSFFIHALSGTIVADGHAKWILNPLSLFGWYPLSYPSAGPFLLASTSVTTGVNLEASILLVAMMLGPIGILGAFIMARQFRPETSFGLCVALIYGLAPRFLSFTLWSASTRNLFMAILPIFVWALLRQHRRNSAANLVAFVLSLSILAATHRLIVLMVAVFLAFLVAVVVQVAARTLRIRFPEFVLQNATRRVAPYAVILSLVALSGGVLLGTNVLQDYSKGELLSGSHPATQATNLAISIARSGGLALPLLPIGLVKVVRQRNKGIGESFLAMALLALIPTLSLRNYAGFLILPFLAIFGALGLIAIVERVRRTRWRRAIVSVGLVVAIAGFSSAVLEVEILRSGELPSHTYVTGTYLRELRLPGTVIANDGLTGVHVASVSGVRILPVGGAGTTFQSPELLAYRFYTPDEVNQVITRVDIFSITIESDSIWVAGGIQAEADWVYILDSAYGHIPSEYMRRYEPSVYLEADRSTGTYLAYDNQYCSNLALTMHEEAYRIYSNGEESLWWIYSGGTREPSGSGLNRCRP
jgi:hypothetical protein